jgi:hypothetical protein
MGIMAAHIDGAGNTQTLDGIGSIGLVRVGSGTI